MQYSLGSAQYSLALLSAILYYYLILTLLLCSNSFFLYLPYTQQYFPILTSNLTMLCYFYHPIHNIFSKLPSTLQYFLSYLPLCNIFSFLPFTLQYFLILTFHSTIFSLSYLPLYNISSFLPSILQYFLFFTFHSKIFSHSYLPLCSASPGARGPSWGFRKMAKIEPKVNTTLSLNDL